MTTEQNLENMKRCPQFEDCSIPKCPLDYWMNDRVELPEDDKCPLGRLIGGVRGKRRKGILSPSLRGMAKFIPEINQVSEKTGTPKAI